MYCGLNGPPNVVRVPVRMDNNNRRADGDGARLIGGVQTMFSQVNSVGVTAAWSNTKTKRKVMDF